MGTGGPLNQVKGQGGGPSTGLRAMRRYGDCDPFHLDLSGLFDRLSKIVLHLYPKPHLWAAAEGLGKSNGHFWGNSGLPIDQVIQGLTRDAEPRRSVSNCQAKRLNALLANNPAGMRGVLHTHNEFPFHRAD